MFLTPEIHAKKSDPEFDNGWDLPAARTVVDHAEHGELFLSPSEEHLFADSSLLSCDPNATALMTPRVIAFLDRV